MAKLLRADLRKQNRKQFVELDVGLARLGSVSVKTVGAIIGLAGDIHHLAIERRLPLHLVQFWPPVPTRSPGRPRGFAFPLEIANKQALDIGGGRNKTLRGGLPS